MLKKPTTVELQIIEETIFILRPFPGALIKCAQADVNQFLGKD